VGVGEYSAKTYTVPGAHNSGYGLLIVPNTNYTLNHINY